MFQNKRVLKTKICSICGKEYIINGGAIRSYRCPDCRFHTYTGKCYRCGRPIENGSRAELKPLCYYCRHVENLGVRGLTPQECGCYMCKEEIHSS